MKVCQLSGSVFPQSLLVAIPNASLSYALVALINGGHFEFMQEQNSVLRNNAAWGGFTFAIGFLIVFRTSQSYNRFWDGCTSVHRMRAEWFDACSSLVAFTRGKNLSDKEKEIREFKNLLVRLTSMLHAAALGEIEDSTGKNENDLQAFSFDLLDVGGVDETSLAAIRDSHTKVELIFQWLQQLVIDNINSGVLTVPPPILSRSFQELSNGMVAFHDAMKISYIPFPFPYAQICDFLLCLHWCVIPFVHAHWVTEPFWAFIFTFCQVFVLWALNSIAVQLENPFGTDANDIDGRQLQQELNSHLILLLSIHAQRVPTLTDQALDLSSLADGTIIFKNKSFCDAWRQLGQEEVPKTARRANTINPRLRESISTNGHRLLIRLKVGKHEEQVVSDSFAGSSSQQRREPQLLRGEREAKVEDVTCVLGGEQQHVVQVQGGREEEHRSCRHRDGESTSDNSHGSSLAATDERANAQEVETSTQRSRHS